MNVHLARRLVVDRDADGADVCRGIANRQFARSRQAGEFDALAGIRQCHRSASGSATISNLGRAGDGRGFFRLERVRFSSDGGSKSGECQRGSRQENPELVHCLVCHKRNFLIGLLPVDQATQLTQSSGLRRPSFKWISTGLPSGKCSSHAALSDCGFAVNAPEVAEIPSMP